MSDEDIKRLLAGIAGSSLVNKWERYVINDHLATGRPIQFNEKTRQVDYYHA